MDASIVMSTASDAVTATPFKNESPRISMPSRAMQTVEPAKSTARPEVLRAHDDGVFDVIRVSAPVGIS